MIDSHAPEKRSILVTDAHQIGGLGVIRSLGMANYTVFGAAPGQWQNVGGCRSRYLQHRLVSPSPWSNVSDYAEWLSKICRRHNIDAVFPVSEAAMIAASDAKARGSLPESHVIGPSSDALRQCLSIGNVVTLLQKVGIAVPDVRTVCDADNIHEEVLAEVTYPIAVHRPLALSERGRLRAPADRICYSRDELMAFADECISLGAPLLIFGDRSDHGVSIYCTRWHGTDISQFAQKSIHEADIGRLLSSLREEDSGSLASLASQVLRVLNLDGMHNVRFRLGNEGNAVFDGITPGVPGSISLPILKGVSLPAQLVDHTLGVQHVPPPARVRLRRCSNFYPGEVRFLSSQLRPLSLKSVIRLGRGAASVLLNKLDPRTGADYFWWSDWQPGLAQLVAMFRARGRATPASERILKTFTPLAERRRRPRLPDNPPRRILFVCHGNVCRSYLAEHRLRFHLSKAGIRSIRVRSAGTGTPGGRLPPEKFRRVFERFGLSVDNHRSRGLDKEEIARADMVIYMDSDNLANLRRLGFQPAKSWHYLGAFAADKKMKIPDPVNAAPQDAVRIFDYVEHCVACLAEVLQASPSQSPVPKDP